MRRASGVVACLVVLSLAVPAVTAGASASAAQSESAFAQSAVDPDSVLMEATVREDGTADWSVAYRVRLEDENDTAAFESVQADIRENPSAFTDRFETGMARTVRSAENTTGREMALRNVTVEAERQTLGQEYGVVTYRFTWDGFAAADGDRLRVGDALTGLFLDDETTLTVFYPEGYAVEEVRPSPSEDRETGVVWRGPVEFGPEEPRLVVGPGGPDTALLAAAAVVAVALLGGGALAVSRRRGPGDEDSVAAGEAGAAGAAAAASETDTDDEDEDEDDGPPEELLSNEEMVLRLLDDEGGRVKQQQIAGEFDWTDAKTSQVVGTLREEDRVETFRIGRENVVTLPEESDL